MRAAAAATRPVRASSNANSRGAPGVEADSDTGVDSDAEAFGAVSESGHSAGSVIVISDSDMDSGSEARAPARRGLKRKRAPARRFASKGRLKKDKSGSPAGNIVDIEDCASLARPHAPGYHSVQAVAAAQDALLDWFESVR